MVKRRGRTNVGSCGVVTALRRTTGVVKFMGDVRNVSLFLPLSLAPTRVLGLDSISSNGSY